MQVREKLLCGPHYPVVNNFLTGSLDGLGGAQKGELVHRWAVEEIIDFLEIEHIRKEPAGQLPYGLRKRVELARAIALKPDLLLLDEPIAGMDLEEKEDMARFVVDMNAGWGMTVVMIMHDLGVFLDRSTLVVVLDLGRQVAEGIPGEVPADPMARPDSQIGREH